jgi:AbiU2
MVSFKERLDELLTMVDRVKAAWETWLTLDEARADHEGLDALNDYGDFFGIVMHSLLAATFTGLYQLFDKRSDVLTVRRLVADAESDPRSSQVSPPDLSAALAEADPILERLKVPRHELFAHRDYTSTWNDVFDAAGLTRPELTRLVELTVSMASAISVWYENTHPDFSSLAPADAQMLIERLKEPT